MNRFAAELLMPEAEFRTLASKQIALCRKEGSLPILIAFGLRPT